MSFGAFASSPSARGRVLVHVVDLDSGEEARIPARMWSRAHPGGSRVRIARDGSNAQIHPLGPRGSRRAGTYRGLFWVRPAP